MFETEHYFLPDSKVSCRFYACSLSQRQDFNQKSKERPSALIVLGVSNHYLPTWFWGKTIWNLSLFPLKVVFFWNEQINVLLKFWSVRDKWWNPYRLCLFNLIRISEAGKLDMFLIINSDRNCFPWNSFPVVDKPPWRFEGHTNRRHHQPGANAGFPAGGGADPSGGGANLRFCKKIPKPYEIEKMLGRRGGRAGSAPS